MRYGVIGNKFKVLLHSMLTDEHQFGNLAVHCVVYTCALGKVHCNALKGRFEINFELARH